MPIAEERAHMQQAVETLTEVRDAPLGWYTGRTSQNTRTLVTRMVALSMMLTIIQMICRSLLDDRSSSSGGAYTLDTNDMRFATAQISHRQSICALSY